MEDFMDHGRLEVKGHLYTRPSEDSTDDSLPRSFNIGPLRLDLKIGDVFVVPNIIVGEHGEPVDQEMLVCDYLLRHNGVFYLTRPFVPRTEYVRPNAIPESFKDITPHGFLFSLQQQVKQRCGVSCRVTFAPDCRKLALEFKDAYSFLKVWDGLTFVNISQPRAMAIKIDNGVTLTLENEAFNMDGDKIAASASAIKSLRRFVSALQTPEERNEAEIEAMANMLRRSLTPEQLGRHRLDISDDPTFVQQCIMRLLAPQESRFTRFLDTTSSYARVPARHAWQAACAVGRRLAVGIMYGNRRLVRLVVFLLENQLLSLLLYVLLNLVIAVLLRRVSIFIEVTMLGLLALNIAIAVLKTYVRIDTLNLLVLHTFPTVYPREVSPAEMEKYVQQLSDVDSERLEGEINAVVARTRVFPSIFQIFAITVFSTIPSLVFLWKQQYRLRKLQLIQSIQVELKKESERRVASAAAAPLVDSQNGGSESAVLRFGPEETN